MIERKASPRLGPFLFGLLAALLGLRSLRADEMMRQVQEELRKRHLYFGDVDGRLTPEVSAALRRYQEGKGFSPSGTADENTLRSLTLVPPPPANLAAPPLPDTTVLRSDQGLVANQAGEVISPALEKGTRVALPSSTPTPTPAQPPAAVSMQRPDAAAIRAFIERYLQAGQTNDPESELRFYGDRVDYFDDGPKDRAFIERDVRRFEARWPERQFSLVGPLTIGQSPDGDPGKVEVRFRYRFAEKGSRFAATGEANTEYVLVGTRPEDLHIVSMKEQRVRP